MAQDLALKVRRGGAKSGTCGAAADIFVSSALCCSQRRKPYTITKQREPWTEEEHTKFLEALRLHGRAWTRIQGECRLAALVTTPPWQSGCMPCAAARPNCQSCDCRC